MTIYAFGDVHGHCVELTELLGKIEPVAGDTVVFVGDYIDRGPDSKGVIELVRSYHPDGVKVVALKGNHEDMMVLVHEQPEKVDWWFMNGGRATIESYGGTIPPSILEWADKLPISYEQDGYFFCHAGVDPDNELSNQTDEALLWIREKFLCSKKDFLACIVHGHTPAAEPEVLPNRINIDTGCCFGGALTCAVLGNDEPLFIQTGAPTLSAFVAS